MMISLYDPVRVQLSYIIIRELDNFWPIRSANFGKVYVSPLNSTHSSFNTCVIFVTVVTQQYLVCNGPVYTRYDDDDDDDCTQASTDVWIWIWSQFSKSSFIAKAASTTRLSSVPGDWTSSQSCPSPLEGELELDAQLVHLLIYRLEWVWRRSWPCEWAIEWQRLSISADETRCHAAPW